VPGPAGLGWAGLPGRRTGEARALLILDGVVDSVRIGRLRRVPADALAKYLDQLRAIQAADSDLSA
jgi:hypothetical protein